MASYYFSYNGVDLSNLARVRSVETTDLPPRENNAITIWERPGSIYNSYRYGERDIVVTFLVRATAAEIRNNPNIMDSKLWKLRSVFRVDKPQPLYLGTKEKYIYAVPEGDYTATELRYDCYECKIQFVCHNPEYYAASVSSSKTSVGSTYGMRNISNNNAIEVYNGGDASAYPIINVGINNDASFIQVENTTNGNKFLIGSYPKAGKEPIPLATSILNDDMTDPSLWTAGPPYIDSGRGCLGSIYSTSDGSGIRIAEAASGSLWSGIGARRVLRNSLQNFEVRAKLHLNSYGVEGDPTVPQIRDGAIDPSFIEYRYKVIAPSVNIKESAGEFGNVIGSYDKGELVNALYSSNGWIQTDKGWCEAIYFRKYIIDRSSTWAAMNVVAKGDLELMSLPSDNPKTSKLLATIEGGTALRVETVPKDGYYKLYIPYNGKIGYIDEDKVETFDGAEVKYPEDEIIMTDDYKTGICEVYGYSESGTKLFKLSLTDDNKYYSFTKPAVEIGGNTVLEDIATAPSSNKATNEDESNVGYDYLSEGGSGDWNEFYGELGIQRKNGKWEAWIYKIEYGSPTKRLMLKQQEVNGASNEALHHVVIYMGTQDTTSMCGMAITNIEVDEIRSDINSNNNVMMFRRGDEIKIDCCNNKVYLNNKLFNDIDIDSQFIELVTGNNVLKVTSDDSMAFTSVLFNEKYL
jgi:predicted phage tail component-like protein